MIKIERIGKEITVTFGSEVAARDFEAKLRRVAAEAQKEVDKLRKEHAHEIGRHKKRVLWAHQREKQ